MAKKPGANKPGSGKLGGAVMSLFLDKRARDALKAQKSASHPAPETPTPDFGAPVEPTDPHPSQDEINARLDEAAQTRARRAAQPGRQALIQDALRIHADKSKMLDDLPEEQQRKLKAMAMMTLMPKRGGDGGED